MAERPPGPIPCMIWCCDPWDRYIESLVEENERERLGYELEEDLKRERERQPQIEAAEIEYVEVELMAEVQR